MKSEKGSSAYIDKLGLYRYHDAQLFVTQENRRIGRLWLCSRFERSIRYCRATVIETVNTPKAFRKNASVALSFLYVQETNPPEGMEPIEWYSATSMDTANADEAMERVRWYVHRWKIERFHYILKNGCEIEELQARTAERLQKLILMYSVISVRILGMTYLARQKPETSCTEFIEEQEWKVLYCIANKTSQIPSTVPMATTKSSHSIHDEM